MTPALLDIYDSYRTSKHFKSLRETGSRLVQGSGPATAKVMIIGDAPGATENDSGVPFTGRSGQVLDSLLGTAGLTRSDVFLTYVVKYRTPGNRRPSTAEIIRSTKFLRREWLEIKPLLTIAAGTTVAAVIESEDQIHGVLFPYWYNDDTHVYHKSAIVYHPSFGLKNKKARQWIEKEWSLLGEEIAEHAPDVLCKDCKGAGPRGKVKCNCSTFAISQ